MGEIAPLINVNDRVPDDGRFRRRVAREIQFETGLAGGEITRPAKNIAAAPGTKRRQDFPERPASEATATHYPARPTLSGRAFRVRMCAITLPSLLRLIEADISIERSSDRHSCSR